MPTERRYAWDEVKRLANISKREIDFTDVEGFDWDTADKDPSNRHGETRFVSTGYIADRLHVVVYTMRVTLKRIIQPTKGKRKVGKTI